MRALLCACVAIITACASPRVETALPAPTNATASPAAATPAPEPSLTTEPAPTPSPAPTIALPQCRQPLPQGPLIALCPDGAILWVDDSLSREEQAAQVEDDLAAVQREFKWTLRTRAVIHVRAGRDGYVDTLRSVFGYGAATAEYIADNSVAFFEPSLRTIAVNWDEVRDRRPIAAIRHELTHVITLEACAPRCDLVPAWFSEGEARLQETTVGAEW